MTPEIEVTTVPEEDSIEESFLMAGGGDPLAEERRRIAEEDAAEAEGAPDSDANARARSRELREGAEGNRKEAFDELPARDGKVGSDAGDPLAELTEKFGMSIQKIAERAKSMAASEDPNLAAQGKGILGLIEEGEALVAPFISPVDALSGGFASTAKLAGRAGVKGMARVGRGLAGGASAVATEIPAGLAVEGVAENHPALAFPFALFLGIAVGGTLEAALERGMFRGSKTVINLWKLRKAAKIEAGISPEKAAEIAIKEVVAESEPSDVLALAKDVKDVEGSFISSANRNKNLTREEAIEGLKAPEHQALRKNSENLDTILEIKNKERVDALGRYKGRSEPSLRETMEAPDRKTFQTKAAMLGKAHDQDEVIALVYDSKGPNTVFETVIPKAQASMVEVDDSLSATGLDGWSLKPEKGGTRVLILDIDGSAADKVKAFADFYGVEVDAQRASAEFVKREQYDGIIGEAKTERPDRFLALEGGEGGQGKGRDSDQPGTGEPVARKTEAPPEGEVTPPGPPEPEPATIRKATPEEIKRFVETDPSTVKVGDNHVLKIDFSAIGDHAEIEGVINKVSAFYAKNIDEARRGILTDKAVRELAEEIGVEPEKLLARQVGEAFNAEQLLATINLLGASGKNLAAISKRVEAGDASAVADMTKALANHEGIQEVFFGARAEAGRALRILQQNPDGTLTYQKRLAQVIAEAEEEGNSVVLNRVRGRKPGIDPVRLATAILSLDSPAKLAYFTRKLARPGGVDMFFEIWYGSILGPGTISINAIGNTITAFASIPERAIASRLGRGGVEVGEATVLAYGMVNSFMDAIRIGVKSWKTGESAFGDAKFGTGRPPAITTENLELTGVPGRAVDAFGYVVRTIGRSLMATDAYFKQIMYRAELHALSYRKAISEGLKGDDLAARIAELLDEVPESLKAPAQEEALYRTFTTDLGKFGGGLQKFAEHPAGRIIMPFVRISVNIGRVAFDFTPPVKGLEFLAVKGLEKITPKYFTPLQTKFSADIAAGGARRQTALAKLSLGSMMMMTASVLTSSGRITGAGPKNKDLRRQWLKTHQPYSIMIGGKWIAYGRLDPFGMVIGMAADFSYLAGQMDRMDGDKLIEAAGIAVAQNIFSKNYMRGLAGFLNAALSPERHFAKQASQLFGSFVPGGATLRAANRAFNDNAVREVRGLMDKIMANIPGLSDKLPPQRDIFGEPRFLEGGLGPDFVTPIYQSTPSKDPVDIELVRLGVPFGMPPRSIQGVELNGEEYDRFVVLAGKEMKFDGLSLKPLLARLFKSKEYLERQDGDREVQLRMRIRLLRELAVEKLLGEGEFSDKKPEAPDLAELVKKARQKKLDARGLIPR